MTQAFEMTTSAVFFDLDTVPAEDFSCSKCFTVGIVRFRASRYFGNIEYKELVAFVTVMAIPF